MAQARQKKKSGSRSTYADDGCGHGCVRSTECPFSECLYDNNDIWRDQEREKLASEARSLRATHSTQEIADILGISTRTVFRLLAV